MIPKTVRGPVAWVQKRLWLLSLPVLAATAPTLAEPTRKIEIAVCNQVLNQLESASTWEAAKQVGVGLLEVQVSPDLSCPALKIGTDHPYSLATEEAAAKLRADADTNGLRISAFVAGIPLKANPEEDSKVAEWAKPLIERAGAIGVNLVYFPVTTDNFTQSSLPDEVVVTRTEAILKGLVPVAGKAGVRIAVENLSVYWNRPAVLGELLRRFPAEDLGLCLDPVNLYWFGHSPYAVHQIVSDFIPRTFYFHVKDLSYPVAKQRSGRTPGWKYGEHTVPVGKGDLDFERMLLLLSSSGFKGAVAIEDDSLGKFPVGERTRVLRSDVRYLERILYGAPSDLELESR